MTEFLIEAMPQDVAERVWSDGADPVWGYPAIELAATNDGGTCRRCLREVVSSDRTVLLVQHDTFAGVRPFPQPGPVLLHTHPCPAPDPHTYPPHLAGVRRTFETFDAEGDPLELVRHPGGEEEKLLADLLDRPGVAFVNVRNTGAGCYLFRVRRAGS